MSDKTGIEWTDATWNPVTGCSKVSQGCKYCYAERDWARLSANPGTKYFGRDFTEVATHAEVLPLPCRWTKPRRIFVNSMSDLFHEAVSFEFIAAVFGVMAAASWHTFQVLTKRPERTLEFFAWLDAHPERAEFDSARLQEKYPGADWRPFLCADLASRVLPDGGDGLRVAIDGQWPLPNVWLGVSVEDQAAADERVPLLLRVPAAVRFLSIEPLLGPISLTSCGHIAPDEDGPDRIGYMVGPDDGKSGLWPTRAEALAKSGLHWVIVGGESGPKARPMHLDWARDLRDQCTATGVPFLFKQWGEYVPAELALVEGRPEPWRIAQNGSRAWSPTESLQPRDTWVPVALWKPGKRVAGRLLDGVEHNGYPEVCS